MSESEEGERERDGDDENEGNVNTNVTANESSSNSREQVRVLHVDDDDAFLELAATFVTRANDRLAVETETDVDRALESGILEEVECVVSDYDMPPTDGLTFLERVRERWPTMPFILYTGKGSEEIASEAISAGVTDYLQKEVGTDQYEVLANRIENAVEQRRAKRGFEDRERRFRIAVTESFDVIWVLDLETGTFDWHDGLCETFGFDGEQVESTVSWWASRIHPDDRTRVVDSLKAAIETEEPWSATFRFRDGTDEYTAVRSRGRTVTDGTTPIEMIGALADTPSRGDST